MNYFTVDQKLTAGCVYFTKHERNNPLYCMMKQMCPAQRFSRQYQKAGSITLMIDEAAIGWCWMSRILNFRWPRIRIGTCGDLQCDVAQWWMALFCGQRRTAVSVGTHVIKNSDKLLRYSRAMYYQDNQAAEYSLHAVDRR